MQRDPTVTYPCTRAHHTVQPRRPRSRPPQACGSRPTWSGGRCGSSGGRGGRDARSPATKHALLVNSAMSAMHRYASLCEVEREEGESAHRKAAAAALSYSAPLAATVDGPHGSSCDDSITPRARQSGWTVTGGTGMIGRRGTPEGSSNVVGDEDLAHQQCGGDKWMQPGQHKHLRATCRQVAAVSSQECLPVKICGPLLHLQSSSCRGRG